MMDAPVAYDAYHYFASSVPAYVSYAQRPYFEIADLTGRTIPFLLDIERSMGISPERAAEKHVRMSRSIYDYYAATPSIFIHDMRGDFHAEARFIKDSPLLLVLGDPHMDNFGTLSFGDSVVWGVNDFDQVGKGYADYDLIRLSVSFLLRFDSLSEREQSKLISAIGSSYFDEIQKNLSSKPSTYLTLAEAQGDVKALILKKMQKSTKKKYILVDGKYRFKDDSSRVSKEKFEHIVSAFQHAKMEGVSQSQIKILDIIEKNNSGGSSYGLTRYRLLFLREGESEPKILELKQLFQPALVREDGTLKYASAKRTYLNQKKLGGVLNPYSGYIDFDSASWMIRLRDPSADELSEADLKDFDSILSVARQEALVLARNHARSDGAAKKIFASISADKGKFLSDFELISLKYRDQVRADFNQFSKIYRTK